MTSGATDVHRTHVRSVTDTGEIIDRLTPTSCKHFARPFPAAEGIRREVTDPSHYEPMNLHCQPTLCATSCTEDSHPPR